jgi:hypothetical protein
MGAGALDRGPAAAVLRPGLGGDRARVSRGQSRRRAAELVLGVAIGIAIADLLGRTIGTGALQIGAVIGLTMAVALAVGAGAILINQAAISAVLVMTLPAGGPGAARDRFFDALIGGAVALAFSQVLFVRDPVAPVTEAIRSALDELAISLRAIADALAEQSLTGVTDALHRARSIDDQLSRIDDALAMARDNAWISSIRHPATRRPDEYADMTRHLDHAVRKPASWRGRPPTRCAIASLSIPK